MLFKGIIGGVFLQRLDGSKEEILGWTMFGFPLDDGSKLRNYSSSKFLKNNISLRNGPALFYGEFSIFHEPQYDTYINPTGWGKVITLTNFSISLFCLFYFQISIYRESFTSMISILEDIGR